MRLQVLLENGGSGGRVLRLTLVLLLCLWVVLQVVEIVAAILYVVR